MRNSETKRFSLIELLIVIGILGALIALFIPSMGSQEDYAKDTIRDKEMADIRKAFQKFYSDNAVSDEQLKIIAKYGLWPLMTKDTPDSLDLEDSAEYTEFDFDRGRGWKGPYLMTECRKDIYAVSGTGDNDYKRGQETQANGSGIRVPVLLDPYDDYADKEAACTAMRGCYRVMIPSSGGSLFPKHIVLVCTGKSWSKGSWPGASAPQSEKRAFERSKLAAGIDNSDGYITAVDGSDFKVIRLLPLAE